MCSRDTDSRATPETICVIGCGPGGMSFCHAIETKRREQQQQQREATSASQNGNDGTANTPLPLTLPIVTCFERTSHPGGVWRAVRGFGSSANHGKDVDDSSHLAFVDEKKCDPELPSSDTTTTATTTTSKNPTSTSTSTQMYEALWTNGPKEAMEYFDHTFDEHFGKETPTYLPRAAMLEYMMRRVTKHCPDFFDKYCRFRVEVMYVEYNATRNKFDVIVKDLDTMEVSTLQFDKCIWAAGNEGRAQIPKYFHETFANFKGQVLHSSQVAANFKEVVSGQRILLVGGAYSAEDLALMAVKVGVEHVYVSSRQYFPPAAFNAAWPQDKVTVLTSSLPLRVKEDSDGRTIEFTWAEWIVRNQYDVGTTVTEELKDIDTIILCTGYCSQMTMLSPALREPYDTLGQHMLPMPRNWTMDKHEFSDVTHDVPVGDVLWNDYFFHRRGLYNGFVIDNLNMMFLDASFYDTPLLAIDVKAWFLADVLFGTRKLPSKQEMQDFIQNEAQKEYNNLYMRYCNDGQFKTKLDEGVPNAWDDYETNLDHWFTRSQSVDYYKQFRCLARLVQESTYPLDLGTFDELNARGQALHDYQWDSYKDRAYSLKGPTSWQTFRDVTDPSKYKSVITGSSSVPLPQPWLEIDEVALADDPMLTTFLSSDPQQEKAEDDSNDDGDESSDEVLSGVTEQQLQITNQEPKDKASSPRSILIEGDADSPVESSESVLSTVR